MKLKNDHLKNQKSIELATPDLKALEQLNHDLGVATTHLFTFKAEDKDYDLFTRDFAPAVGIPEDPVTGSTNGALAGFLALEGFLDRSKPTHHLKIAQGHTVGRPGSLYVTVKNCESTPIIQVEGKAHITIAGELRLSNKLLDLK